MKNSSSVEMIARDTPCFRCGYNLRGLAVDGRCPECGVTVRLSQAGRHLAASDPRWRRRLQLGAGLHACGLIGFLLIVLEMFYATSSLSIVIMNYMLMVVAMSLCATGAWLTTSREPDGPYFDDAPWLRRLVRGLGVLSWGGMAAFAAIQLREWAGYRSFARMVLWQNIGGTLAFGGGLLVTCLAIWHLSRLAKRLGARRLVFWGRLSAFSPAIMVAVIIGSALLLNQIGVRESSLRWLGATLYAMLFLWPATYQLLWCYQVGRARG